MFTRNKTNALELILKTIYAGIAIVCTTFFLYPYLKPYYQILTVVLTLFGVYRFFRGEIIDKQFFLFYALFILANLISSLVNDRSQLIGNMIEIVLMFSMGYMTVLTTKENQKRLYVLIRRVFQAFALFTAIIAISLFLSNQSLLVPFGEKTFQLGIFQGRLFGLMNPNAGAILSLVSILLSFSNLHRSSLTTSSKVLSYLNIILQFMYFSLQQSRGALLAALVVFALYGFFATKSKNYLRKAAGALSVVLVFLIVNQGVIKASEHYGVALQKYERKLSRQESIESFVQEEVLETTSQEEVTKLKEEPESVTSPPENIQEREHLFSSGSRLVLWRGAVEMGREKFLLGYSNRNITAYYPKFFSDLPAVTESLQGFHNIYLTIFVSTGIVGVLCFLVIVFYVVKRYLTFMYSSSNVEAKIILLIPLAILFQQFFESAIFYTTSGINFVFWAFVGFGLGICNRQLLHDEDELTVR